MEELNTKELEKIIQNIENDISELENLYNLTKTLVYRYALSILKNCDDAEDVMQDVYVNINRYSHLYKSKDKPMAWIFRITKNLCLNKIKKNKNKTEEIKDDIAFKDDISNKVLLKVIFENLNDDDRQIIMLKSVDNFKFKEISTILNLNLSTVLSRYNRAIKKIQKEYRGSEI